MRARAVTIVGGGLSGTSAALQLLRHANVPLAVRVVEARASVGPGLAYSATDADHRLNAPSDPHSVLPEDPGHFTRWWQDQDLRSRDPEACLPSGAVFARRRDYGDYLAATFAARAASAEGGSTLQHVRDRAIGARADRADGALSVSTEGGLRLMSELLIVATGNPAPRLPSFFDPGLLGHPAVVGDPLRDFGLARIDPTARVLVVGTGLTALDVLSTLVRSGHRGAVVAVSRRGLRPRRHAPAVLGPNVPAPATERPLDRITGPVPLYWATSDGPPTALGVLRRMRRRIDMLSAQDQTWHAAIDELRDSLWQIWPLWPAAEKQRFLRALRPWYDVHRFRAPPQNDALVRRAEAEGRVAFRAARVLAIKAPAGSTGLTVRFSAPGAPAAHIEHFDAVVNCTGLDAAAGATSNPFLAALVDQGWLRVDDTRLGFAVDARCRAVDAAGRAQDRVRVIGPPTAGAFADPLGVVFITAQIHRLVPDVLRTLA